MSDTHEQRWRCRLTVDGVPDLEVLVHADEPMVSVAWGGLEIACVVIPVIGTSAAYDGYWSLGRPEEADLLHRPLKASEFLVAGWRGEEGPPEHELGEFLRFHRGVLPGAEAAGLDRLCPGCGADITGNDPHGPDCPITAA
jgi:hypothetical protein